MTLLSHHSEVCSWKIPSAVRSNSLDRKPSDHCPRIPSPLSASCVSSSPLPAPPPSNTSVFFYSSLLPRFFPSAVSRPCIPYFQAPSGPTQLASVPFRNPLLFPVPLHFSTRKQLRTINKVSMTQGIANWPRSSVILRRSQTPNIQSFQGHDISGPCGDTTSVNWILTSIF